MKNTIIGLFLSLLLIGCTTTQPDGINESSAKKVMQTQVWQALVNALQEDDSKFVAEYINAGHDINIHISEAGTPLATAIIFNANKSFKLLLSAGADINKENETGVTPLMLSVIDNRISMLKDLLANAVKLDLKDNKETSALVYAVIENNLEIVNILLKAGANPNLITEHGTTALHYTVIVKGEEGFDFSDVAQALVAGGADINAQTPEGITPLQLSVINNKPHTFSTLLALKANPNIIGTDGITTLMNAFSINNLSMVDALLKSGVDINIQNKEGWTALHYATASSLDTTPFVKKLVEMGADINSLTIEGYTPLLIAIANENTTALATLLSLKADPNFSNSTGLSPLMSAVIKNNSDMVELLIKAGGDPNAKMNEGLTALHYVGANPEKEESDYSKVVSLLIQAGADINSQEKTGATAVSLAVITNRPKTLAVFLTFKPDVNLANFKGGTPLMIAANNNRINMLKALLKAGANLNQKVPEGGWAALHFAITNDLKTGHDYDQIATLLINAGADINVQTDNGHTALSLAIFMDQPKTFSVLLKEKANPNLVFQNGWSPLIIAAYYNRQNMVAPLIAGGAKVNYKTKLGLTALLTIFEKDDASDHDVASIFSTLVDAGATMEPKYLNQLTDHGTPRLQALIHLNRHETFDELLRLNPDLNAVDSSGLTALMIAVDDGDKKRVKALLTKGANPTLKNIDGWTALHYTVNAKSENIHDYPEIAALLIAEGVDINDKTHDGFTPLLISVLNNKPGTFKLLLTLGADPNIGDINGQTPLMYAMENGQTEMVDALIAAGANPSAGNDWRPPTH